MEFDVLERTTQQLIPCSCTLLTPEPAGTRAALSDTSETHQGKVPGIPISA